MIIAAQRPQSLGDRWRNWRRQLGRRLAFLPVAVLLLLRPFKFLHRFLPRDARDVLQSWTAEMMRVFVFSLGTKVYIDQTCTLIEPVSYEPLIDTQPELRLTPEQIRVFYERGFLGPFTLCSREEMIAIREEIMASLETPSAIYGFATGRDRHLDCQAVYELVRRPELTERLAQILGPNLLLWRSQVFLKPPGAPEVTWHQASTYLMEETYRPTLYPPDRDRLFQLTTWLAFDDVDLANGCMQFVPGTHKHINIMHLGGRRGSSFGQANFQLAYDIDPAQVVNMEMQAGQFVIFSERTIHGSPANQSERRRWGMAFRTIRPDVLVYGDETLHQVAYLNEEYPLEKWGAVVLRGSDTAGRNRIIEPFAEKRQKVAV